MLLGFALSEWGSRQADRARAAEALENFRREIQENLSTLERLRPSHLSIAEQFAEVADSGTDEGETGFDVFAAVLPDEYEPLNMREAAWQTASTTGALRLLNYEVAAVLSETYLVQGSIMAMTQLMNDRLSDESNFDPQARNAMIRVWHRLFSDLASQEKWLIERYRLTLKDLAAARP